ncbi:putative pectin methylesterase CGR2 isoform X3 [Primulina tabacum]|uniref:putative pectin methylesterase CGR2 isoform X3 n=1 Tax=Primulina tabacum TaxID=48773 RepID=UPI003F5A41A8
MAMARRPINPSRRTSESGAAPFASSLRSRSRSHPYLPTAFIIVGGFLLIGYFYRGRGTGANKIFSRVEGDFSCTVEVQNAIPLLKMAYGGSMHRVLHVGPDTCSVVSRLLKEKDTEAWGVEPYDIEDADRKYALDYLSPKYLNRTLPELARVSADGVVIFTGYPHHQKAKVVDKAKYGRLAKLRSSIWWIRYFVQMSLEENEAVIKKFEQAAVKRSYTSNCQIFHLNSYS